MDAGDGHRAAWGERRQRRRQTSPAGAKITAESSRSGGVSKVSPADAAPDVNARSRRRMIGSSRARSRPGDGHLDGEVGRGPEAVDPEPSARWYRARRSARNPMIPAHRSGATCSSSNRSGAGRRSARRRRILGVATVGIPPRERRVHAQVPSPRRQNRHTPHVRRSHATPIRSPGSNRVAPSPSASTCPTTSWPGTTSGACGARSPSARCRSVRHTPQTPTRNRTSPDRAQDWALDECEQVAVDRSGLSNDPRPHHLEDCPIGAPFERGST